MTAPIRTYPAELAGIPSPAVIVLIGAAGSGKSMLAHRLAARWDYHVVMSLDACRAYVCGDPVDEDATPAATELMLRLTATRSLERQTTVVDAPNTSAADRAPLVRLATENGLPAIAVVVNTPREVCLARQAERPGPLPGRKWGRRVPDYVVTAQHAAVTAAIPTLHLAEGFASVYVINPEGTYQR